LIRGNSPHSIGGPIAQADALIEPQPERDSLVSGADAGAFLSRFEDQNARVFETYLGSFHGVLFTESPDPSSEAVEIDLEDLEAEELISLLEKALTLVYLKNRP
jgi:hypothetical protein